MTYSLFVPAGHPFARLNATETYRLIHENLCGLLCREKIAATMSSGPAVTESQPCFESPVPHDILLNSRKIAGAAQRRTRWGLLHQGSIQNATLPEKFESLLPGAFAAALRVREPTAEEQDTASKLAKEKYGRPEWTHRF